VTFDKVNSTCNIHIYNSLECTISLLSDRLATGRCRMSQYFPVTMFGYLANHVIGGKAVVDFRDVSMTIYTCKTFQGVSRDKLGPNILSILCIAQCVNTCSMHAEFLILLPCKGVVGI
jgi:hypothetical protein